MKFAGIDDFKLVQEVHRGLRTISNLSQKHLTVKYGQKFEKRVQHAKRAQFLGFQTFKSVFGKAIASRDRGQDIHEVKTYDF